MKRLTILPWAILATLLLVGCQSGDTSRRDDGKVSAVVASQREPAVYEMQVREEAARLMKDHPTLSAKDAYTEARSNVGATYELVGQTRAEREKKETQDKFEEDLAKLGK